MKRASIAALVVLISCGGDGKSPLTTAPVPTPPQVESPITGAALAGLSAFDKNVQALMAKYQLPGGAIAVVRDGKLIYARGFGYADVESKVPVQPDALFRIASVSKPITSAAAMKLIEEGKLHPSDRVAPFIADLTAVAGKNVDPRWEQITIQNLLNHTSGWNRLNPNGGFDPMFIPAQAAAAVGTPAPASIETIVRYMKGMPFDFNPGEKVAYSNFGYALLGLIIERVSGMKYEDYVRSRVLLPVGAKRTRSGRTRMSDAWPDEVKYYLPGMSVNLPQVPSVFPGEGMVPLNYGAYYLEAQFASGAWVSSTIDLLRFVNGIDGRPSPPDILSPQLITEMTTNGPTFCGDGSCIYAYGWWVRPVQNDATWWHEGDLAGTKAIVVRSYNGVSWAALFNAGAPNAFINELDAALWTSLAKVSVFPDDLFPSFK